MTYLEEMTDYRGEFLETEEDSPKRNRIVQHFLEKYTFVNDVGEHTSESQATQKIRLSLKDTRMPTRSLDRKRKRVR